MWPKQDFPFPENKHFYYYFYQVENSQSSGVYEEVI